MIKIHVAVSSDAERKTLKKEIIGTPPPQPAAVRKLVVSFKQTFT